MVNLGPNLEDFRSHFRDFFARGRYVKFDDSCTVWLYFRDLRGAKKGPPKQLKNWVSKNVPKKREKCPSGGPFGRLLGHLLATFLHIGFIMKNDIS